MNILTTTYIERIRIGGVYIYLIYINAALALWAGQCRANISKLWARPSVRAIATPREEKA